MYFIITKHSSCAFYFKSKNYHVKRAKVLYVVLDENKLKNSFLWFKLLNPDFLVIESD
jgi:uncharacterized protein Usg